MTVKKFEAGRGYTQADWDEVSDSPNVTAEMVAEMKPFAEVFPTLAEKIKGRSRERDATTGRFLSAQRRQRGDGKKRA